MGLVTRGHVGRLLELLELLAGELLEGVSLMGWLRLDDGFDDHPKLVDFTDGERWRWVRVLLYCSRFETDGVVSAGVLSKLGISPRLRGELVAAELLDELEDGGGYLVHDFLEFNPSKADRERERERWKERKRRSRASEGEDVTGGVTGGHSVESRPLRAGSVPFPFPYNLRSAAAPRGEREDGGELERLCALMPGGEVERDLVRGEAARAAPELVSELVREVGAGVVDPLGHVLERLRRARGAL